MMTLSFGSVLRQAREIRGLSATEAARTAGISSAYLSKLENDAVKKPSPQVLHQLAGVLGVPYAELMVLVGYQVPGKDQTADSARLGAALFADLTDDERDELVEYLAWYRARDGSKRRGGKSASGRRRETDRPG